LKSPPTTIGAPAVRLALMKPINSRVCALCAASVSAGGALAAVRAFMWVFTTSMGVGRPSGARRTSMAPLLAKQSQPAQWR
jgi:hypothetical protein